MANDTDGDNSLSKLNVVNKIDPTEFDVTIGSLLIGLGAEKYIDIFRKKNIGQSTLIELTDEDLSKLGVDDAAIREKLLEIVKDLPIYEECHDVLLSRKSINLNPMEIVDILEASSQHLYRIYLSMLANTLALKKTKKIQDCLVYREKYASDIALTTLSEITNLLNSMDISLHTQLKTLTKESSNNLKRKKVIVGAIGTAVISVLALMFVRSLKDLK
ncbi:uncharacterized protein LOC106131814 [Amyelois transitella]|uniref:uncharacterized protein LOC106131814 n=1 Tax=Amyelois transitella TaxID=680683 RepID=UPI0029900B04|nr:uncharacterized protein LOC106131814 [Amyelois transitella]